MPCLFRGGTCSQLRFRVVGPDIRCLSPAPVPSCRPVILILLLRFSHVLCPNVLCSLPFLLAAAASPPITFLLVLCAFLLGCSTPSLFVGRHLPCGVSPSGAQLIVVLQGDPAKSTQNERAFSVWLLALVPPQICLYRNTQIMQRKQRTGQCKIPLHTSKTRGVYLGAMERNPQIHTCAVCPCLLQLAPSGPSSSTTPSPTSSAPLPVEHTQHWQRERVPCAGQAVAQLSRNMMLQLQVTCGSDWCCWCGSALRRNCWPQSHLTHVQQCRHADA